MKYTVTTKPLPGDVEGKHITLHFLFLRVYLHVAVFLIITRFTAVQCCFNTYDDSHNHSPSYFSDSKSVHFNKLHHGYLKLFYKIRRPDAPQGRLYKNLSY